MIKTDKSSYVFYLNMQMLADEFQDLQIPIRYYPGHASACLSHARIYTRGMMPDSHQVSIVKAEDFEPSLTAMTNASFIVIGDSPQAKGCLCSAIFVLVPKDILDILDIVQNIFVRNAKWAGELQTALIEGCSLDELCRISQPYFNNPVFMHNPQYYILGSSGWMYGMSEWDYDKMTGMNMISANLVNNFKTDPEYADTMSTKGAHIYSGNFRSFRCGYVNIWDAYDQYEGRLCINELLSPLKPGQFHAMEYLALIMKAFLQNKTVSQNFSSRPFEKFLREILDGKIEQADLQETVLERQGWHKNDRYVCISLAVSQRDFSTRTITTTCNMLRTEFADSTVFYYKDNILVLINLTLIRSDTKDCLQKLSPIIREGLLRAGVSNEFCDIMLLPQHYIQADLALSYSNHQDATIWCHRFQNVALSYCVRQACQKLSPRFICAPDLLRIKEYDRENESELYHTLEVYLQNDQNAAKTAQLLFIHRSTLFYRLGRIKSLMELDWEKEEDQLYLRLSFYMLAHYDEEYE